MKIALPLAALVLAAPFANAQGGVTGTFRADDVGFAPWIFNLTAKGATLTGTISQSGAGTSLTSPTAIYDGAVDGKSLSFKCEGPGGGKIIIFSGVLNRDVITFDRTVQMQAGADPGLNGIYGASGASHFTARRVQGAAAANLAAPGAAAPAPPPAGLQVVFLGTGTPNPDPTRSGPAVVVVAGPQGYLVDAGPGVVRRAREASDRTQIAALRPAALNYLFLTHLHSDHTLGYPDLIFTPAVIGRGKPLTVFGPKGTKDMTDHLMAAWKKDMDVRTNGLEHGNPEAYKVNVTEIKPGVIHKDANVTVKAFLVPHATWDQAFGYRFETADRSIVISGDTKPTAAIVEACNGCDVLIHEVYCSSASGQASPYYQIAHTSTAELAQIAMKAKPKLLVLYHQLFGGCSDGALLQQMQKAYPGAVVSAKDFDIF